MAELGQLSYSIILNDKDFNKQALEIQKKLKNVDAAITGLAEGDVSKLADRFNTAGFSIDKLKAQAKTLETTFTALSQNGMTNMSQDAQNLRLRWQEIRNELITYGYRIKSAVMEQQTLNGALKMQENTEDQIKLKQEALISVRKQLDKTNKDELVIRRQINEEYIRLNDELKKMGARSYTLNDLLRNKTGTVSPLGFSIQQIARELPSATMGLNMFFLAISNNLPIFNDELKKAQASYKALVAEGKAATPVWKQVVSSIVSWQTAMVVAITLLTAYGSKIWEWTRGLFGAEAANEKLTDAISEQTNAINKEQYNIYKLFNDLRNTTKGTDDYKKAKDKIIDQYGEYLNGLSEEIRSLNNVEAAYQAVSRAALQAAKDKGISAAQDKVFEEYGKTWGKEAPTLVKLLKSKGYSRETIQSYMNNLYNGVSMKDNPVFKQMTADIYFNEESTYKNILDARKEFFKEIKKIDEAFDFGNSDIIEGQKDLIKEAERALKESELMPKRTYEEIVARNKAIKAAQDEINRLNKLGIPDEKAQGKTKSPSTDSDQESFKRDMKRSVEDLQTKVDQAWIDTMNEGFDKRISQMRLNNKTEIREIERQREDLLRKIVDNERKLFEANPANKGRKFDSSGITLPKTQQDNYTKYILDTEKKQNKELSDEYSKALEKYRTYAEARIYVIKKFESERKAVIAAGGSEENLSELNRQQKEALSELDKQYAMKEESYKKWLDGIANLALDKIITSLREAELALSLSQISLKGENDPSRNTQQVAVLRQQIEALKKQIETEKNKKTRKNNSDDPSRTIKDWKRLETVLDRVSHSFDEIGEAVGGTVGDIISAAGRVTTSTLSMINGITQLANWSAISVEMTAKGASAAIQAVEKASVILAIIGAALQIATKIASLFAADYSEYNKARKAYESYIAVLDQVIEKQKELVDTMTGENARNSYEYALELINGQVAAARELGKLRVGSGSSVGSHSIGYRTLYKNMSEEARRQFYAVLPGDQYDFWKIGGLEGLFDLSVEQLTELQEKAPLFWAQLDEDTRNYLNDIIASEQAVKDLVEAYQESLTGLSFDDARDSLKDFLLDTDTTMQDIADNFEDYMKNAIVNSLIKGQLTDSLKKWYENFADYAESDGQLTQSEIDRLRNEYNRIYEQAIKDRDNLFNIAGIVPETNTERTGLSGSLARASQDSIDELTGVMYAGLEKLSLTSNGINAINITTTAMSAELKAQTMLLRSIDNYSSNLPDINLNSKYIRSGIDTMITKGLKVNED